MRASRQIEQRSNLELKEADGEGEVDCMLGIER